MGPLGSWKLSFLKEPFRVPNLGGGPQVSDGVVGLILWLSKGYLLELLGEPSIQSGVVEKLRSQPTSCALMAKGHHIPSPKAHGGFSKGKF